MFTGVMADTHSTRVHATVGRVRKSVRSKAVTIAGAAVDPPSEAVALSASTGDVIRATLTCSPGQAVR